jgi:hypothetical protein
MPVMLDYFTEEETSHESQSTVRQCLIDERLLPLERCNAALQLAAEWLEQIHALCLKASRRRCRKALGQAAAIHFGGGILPAAL